MSLVVTYKGNDLINETENCTKIMKTRGKYLEDDINVQYSGSNLVYMSIGTNGDYRASDVGADGFNEVSVNVQPNTAVKNIYSNGEYPASADGLEGYSKVKVDVNPTLLSASFTENGTYKASDEDADGYSQVTVNVPDRLADLCNNTLRSLKFDGFVGTIPAGVQGNTQKMYLRLVQFSARQYYDALYANTFYYTALKYANCGECTSIGDNCFNSSTSLTSVILTGNGVATLLTTRAFQSTGIAYGTGYVYVPDSLVSSYKSASNWSTYANQIRGFSEAPAYENGSHESGDVCTYNGKFYGYFSDYTSYAEPPSGTTEDNEYWEYIADLT